MPAFRIRRTAFQAVQSRSSSVRALAGGMQRQDSPIVINRTRWIAQLVGKNFSHFPVNSRSIAFPESSLVPINCRFEPSLLGLSVSFLLRLFRTAPGGECSQTKNNSKECSFFHLGKPLSPRERSSQNELDDSGLL